VSIDGDEVFYMPMSVLCRDCVDSPFNCEHYVPRAMRDDALPWEMCKWREEKQEE
jgi:hypothetical protein